MTIIPRTDCVLSLETIIKKMATAKPTARAFLKHLLANIFNPPKNKLYPSIPRIRSAKTKNFFTQELMRV